MWRNGCEIKQEFEGREARAWRLHPTTAKQLSLYLDRREQLAGVETRVLVLLRRKHLHYATVNEAVLFLLRKLGLRGYERLPRKYLWGVVPSIVRNISMKALTLS
jgi:hypothetical protein